MCSAWAEQDLRPSNQQLRELNILQAAELARIRPVVEAAVKWRACPHRENRNALEQIVDT